ncbi:MAG: AsmA family protein [Gammaproteobacteria bacterium]|nr:MAG: AsmA family protein [Gammaproteobacteria bacterium]
MRLWIKALVGGLVLVLVLVAAAVVFISQVDPNEYRGVVADLVESSTGRELRVGGDLAIKLLPVPSMEANDVTFANAAWGSQPHMVRAKRVRAELALLPLLKGRIVVERFVAIEPEVFLETDAEGRGNWQFGEEDASSAESGADIGAPSAELNIIVSQVRIEKAGVAYVDGRSGKKTTLDLDELIIGAERPGGRLALSLRAAYGGLPVTLQGKLGAAGAVLRNQPIEVDLNGTLGEAGFSVQGTVDKPLQATDLRLDVAFTSESTRSVAEVAGIEFEEIGPVNLTLTLLGRGGVYDLDDIKLTARPRNADVAIKGSVLDVTGDPRPDLDVSLSAKTLRQLHETLPDVGPVSVSAKVRPVGKIVEIRDLVSKVGKSDLSGNATVDSSGERPRASAKLRAREIDLAAFAPPADKSEIGTAVQKQSDGRVIPDTPLPLDVLNIANGDIELTVERLITPRLTLDKVNVVVRLDNGNLTVKPAAEIAGGKISATIDIEARAQPAKFTADVDAKKVSISALTKEIRGYETSKGLDSNLNMKLRGQGDSVRALMAGLDGDIRLEIGEGSLNNDVLDRVGADLLTQIVGVAVPTDEKNEVTTLKCGVVRFAVKDGAAIADKTLVMETEKVLLIGGGLIDLKTEDLDLGAKLAARKGIRIGAGTLSSLVRVQGTLAEPQLGTDLMGVVKTGAKVGIAVATVGLSLIAESVYGQISKDDYPCQTALARRIEVTPAKYRAQSTSEEK